MTSSSTLIVGGRRRTISAIVTHARLATLTDAQTSDVTLKLQELLRKKLLASSGPSRSKTYTLLLPAQVVCPESREAPGKPPGKPPGEPPSKVVQLRAKLRAKWVQLRGKLRGKFARL